jgi:putative ABC transport system permease protein
VLAALRWRRSQALVVGLLAALVTACLVLAPLYTRALEQAAVRTSLRAAPVETSGLRLASSSSAEPSIALAPHALVDLVPREARGFFGDPVGSTSVSVRRMPLLAQPGGRLVARDGQCEHVRFTAGRCPTAAREIAVSADQARVHAQRVGDPLAVGEWDGAVSTLEASPRTTLVIVGVYQPVDGPYWFGEAPTGPAADGTGFDDLLTPLQTLTESVTAPDGRPTTWFEPRYEVGLPLLVDRVGVDELGPLGVTLARLVEYPLGVERAGTHVADTVTVRTGLPALAAQARVGEEQAGVTVPLLMAQLGLLLGAVLWLVLIAAADGRRGEIAVARLRGRGARGARRLLLAETLPPIVAGVPLGAGLAVAVTALARHTVLTSDPPFELPLGAWVAAVAALAAMVGLAALSVRGVCRAPVATLVRSVAHRHRGLRLGLLEAMLVAAAVVAALALATGSVGGAVGQVAPTLLALAVGIVAARLVPLVGSGLGRRLLASGRATAGAALLAASRRGTTRWLVPVVVVALALVVVSADALAVGARNRAGRAAAEVGAATVLRLDTADLSAVVGALAAVDPAAAHVTPVVVVTPAGADATATVGVVPSAFPRIARWPGVDPAALAWDRLTAPATAPLTLTGSRLAYHVVASPFDVEQPARAAPPTDLVLGLRIARPDGSIDVLPLGTLPQHGITADQAAGVDCTPGCRVLGIGVLAPHGAAPVNGTLTITGLTVDGRPVDLGGADAWRETTQDVMVTGDVSGSTMRISYSTNGFDQAFFTHASVPGVVPALTTPAARPSAAGATFAGAFVDGTPLTLDRAGDLGYVPGGPAKAAVVSLDNLLVERWRGRGSASIAAYLDSADPALLAQVTTGLAARAIGVTTTVHPEEVEAAYSRTAAAWSLQLALAVGIAALLVAALGVVVLAATSSRARSRDFAALRMAGQRPRALASLARLETVPVVAVAALLGTAVGLWAAPAAVGMLPLFPTPPATYPLDLSTAWGPALAAGGAGSLALVLVTVAASAGAARRADLQRLREVG